MPIKSVVHNPKTLLTLQWAESKMHEVLKELSGDVPQRDAPYDDLELLKDIMFVDRRITELLELLHPATAAN